VQQDLLCRVLGDCVFGASLDSEIGDLGLPTLLDPSQQKFTYVRYNESLDTLPKDVVGPAPLKTDMDNLNLISTLRQIGQKYARDNVHLEHLRPRDESASKSAV
ncbi:MAG TPA: hypothetical protein VMD30_13355, partial [Tepidisphaeraceae bacterium]|nr:hypothetical protein [Tepidisphaeraceae bacterium]